MGDYLVGVIIASGVIVAGDVVGAGWDGVDVYGVVGSMRSGVMVVVVDGNQVLLAVLAV